MTVQCKACGKDLFLDRPNTGDPDMDARLCRLAKGFSHNACFDEARRRLTVQDEVNRMHQRSENWARLCDPFYQTSAAWLAAGKRKVNHVAIKEALEWEFGQRGLMLHGKVSGTGKTTAAWLVLKREHDVGRFIIAMSHGEFTRQATMLAKDSDKASVVWAKIVAECDLLFVDDLGKSRFQTIDGSGKAAEEFLFDLLDSRIRHNRPCLFTTNQDGRQLQARMSQDRAEPFLRRIREFCTAVNFDSGAAKI